MARPTNDELAELLQECGSVSALARRLGRPRETVREWVREAGLRSPLRPGQTKQPNTPSLQPVNVSQDPLCRQLLDILRGGPVGMTDLANRLDRGPETVKRLIDQLKVSGYQIVERHGGHVLVADVPPQAETETHLEPKRGVVKFGIVSDTHLGSRYARLDVLQDLYQRFADEGISDVYHVGDLLDGYGMYRGQEWEQDVHGFDQQVAYAVERYPRISGIRTHIIAGNHDTSYVKSSGADPLVRVAQLRSDFEYLGPYSAWITVTERFRAYLVHPEGGAAYARSYKLQKLIESFQGGRKPNLLIAGHWHDWCVLWERNVWGMLAGCLQDQTDYMRRKALQPKVGGTIVTIRLDRSGAIQSFEPRFVAYLVPEEGAA